MLRTSMIALMVIGGTVGSSDAGTPTTLAGGKGVAPSVSAAVHPGPCISPSLRARIASNSPNIAALVASPPLLPLYPIGGTPYEDVFPGIFVDTDALPFAFRDFDCSDFSYDGHAGHDIGLRSFAEQVIGVPVFAVRDGVVLFAQDGKDDMNVSPGTDDGNYLALDHGGGDVSWYFHLRKGSVAFSVGQSVVEGTQVGLVGSSGYSFGPHLHFEVQQGFVPVEPSAGPCGNTTSLWAHQPPLRLDTTVLDFGVTTQDLFTTPGSPFEQPKQAQVPLGAGFVYFWMHIANIPAQSTWQVRFIRPNGTIALDSMSQPWGNTDLIRFWPGFFYWWVPDVQNTPGTWRYQFDFNGINEIDAPFDVVATVDPNFNRAPSPITTTFEPTLPSPEETLFCRVDASTVTEDLDWDVVRYHYRWKVDGNVVRDVISAGRRDAVPRGVVSAGATVTCEVTPSDGKVDGTTAMVSAIGQHQRFIATSGGKYGHAGVPFLDARGSLEGGSSGTISLTQGRPNSVAILFVGTGSTQLPLLGGTLVPSPIVVTIPLPLGPAGAVTFPFVWPANVPTGFTLALQAWASDSDAKLGAVASNGQVAITP